MLILMRRIGETITIDADIEVTVMGIKGKQVRIGISAPISMAVHRKEVYERIKSGERRPKRDKD